MGWVFAKRGDQVAMVAPSSQAHQGQIESIKNFVRETLKLEPVMMPSEETQKNDNLLGRQVEKNANEFIWALSHPGIRVIWPIAGGRECNSIVPRVREWLEAQSFQLPCRKTLLGFSDITVLHTLLLKNCPDQVQCLHADVLYRMRDGECSEESVQATMAVLFGEKTRVSYRLTPFNQAARTLEKLEAPVMGGNLVTLASGSGTENAMPFKGKIALLEEVNEASTSVHRSLEQLRQRSEPSECLAGAECILFGEFIPSPQEEKGCDKIKCMQSDWVGAYANEIPVFLIEGIGHGKTNSPLPFNVLAVIDRSSSTLEGVGSVEVVHKLSIQLG